MKSIWGSLLFQFILIGLNAVFACAEIAVLSVNEAKITKLEESGSKKAKRLRKFLDQPAKFLSTIQVAITLSGFLGSAFAADNFSSVLVGLILEKFPEADPVLLDNIAVVAITLILSYFTLVLGELVPKRIAMKNSEKLALVMAPMLSAFAKLFTPVVWFLTVSTNIVLRLCGIDPHEEEETASEEEIRLLADEAGEKGLIDEQEQELIKNVFEFDDLTVSEFSTHRTEIQVLWLEEDNDAWEKIIQETGHTRYPVCGESIDDIVGVISMKDYYRLHGADRETLMREAVKPAFFVSEGTHADILFRQMKVAKRHFAVVLDEYGGVSGIVSMNDLLEQLVGDFNSENTEEEEIPDIRQISEDTWEICGSASFGEVAEELELDLGDADYDTFGGYVFSEYGHVPDDGTEFELELEHIHIHVTEIKDHRIIRMTVVKLPDEEEDEDEEDEDED